MKLFVLFLISIAASLSSSAQLSFTRVDTVPVIDDSLPLRNAWAGGLNFPMVNQIDLNGDGIMDIVLYEQGYPPDHDRIMPFINHGDSGMVDYQYAPQYISSFPDIIGWLVTCDYNCDGRMDLFALSDSCSCGIMVYRNDFTPGPGLKFTKITDVLNTYYGSQQFNIPSNSVAVPAFADVDGDGAMDIIAWTLTSGQVEYHRGLWRDSSWNCDSLRFKDASDCWGDFFLVPGLDSARLGEACGTFEADSAIHLDRGNARTDDTQSCICLFEQDSTLFKKQDALVGGFADNNEVYLHNGGAAPRKDSMDYEDYTWPSYNVPVNMPSFPCAYNLDVNNDGKKDMIIGARNVSDYRGVLYYKNTDASPDTGIYTRQPQAFLQQEMIDVGTQSVPQLYDYDGDGLVDLFVGDLSYTNTTGVSNKGIALYKNIGSLSAPMFKLITRDYDSINELNDFAGPICPAFGDLNGDSAADMIIGTGNGNLLYYANTAPAHSAANFVLASTFFDSISFGYPITPQLYDLNHDGLLDLIVGTEKGIIKYYQNHGTPANPVFNKNPTIDTLGGIVILLEYYLTDNLCPFLYNDHGTDKLLVGTENGKVYVYDNISVENLSGNYHLADSLINGQEGASLTLTVGDINHDGHPDMIIGNRDGGLALYMNNDSANGIHEYQKSALPAFDAYPNPVNDELRFNFYHLQAHEACLEMVNSIGQTVFTKTIIGATMNVSTKNLANGIYLARFVNVDNAQSLKIVVRH